MDKRMRELSLSIRDGNAAVAYMPGRYCVEAAPNQNQDALIR